MVGSVTRDVIPAAAATLVTSSSSSSRDLNVGGVVVDSTSETLRRFSTDVISTSRRVTHKHIIRRHLIIRNVDASLVEIESRDRNYQRRALHISLGSQDRRPRAGVGFLGNAQQPDQTRPDQNSVRPEWASPHQIGGLGVRWELSQRGSGQNSRPPKGFPLFSALRMASLDTIILLMDYHAAIGARPPCPSLCTPLGTINAHCFFYSPTGAV